MDFQDAVDEFFVEDVETIIKSTIGVVLSDISYNPEKVNDCSNNIIDSSLKGLQSLNRPYKYAITATLMQKNGAGLVSACSTFWEAKSDGLCKVTWQNNTMNCLVVVFGMALNIESIQMD